MATKEASAGPSFGDSYATKRAVALNVQRVDAIAWFLQPAFRASDVSR
jgi:hypothetical protein